jgi:hypothetical protein
VAGVAVLAAVAGWLLADGAFGVHLAVRSGPGQPEQPIGLAAVLLISALAAALAWGSLALLERITGRARPIWTAIAVVVLVGSLLGPLGGVSTGARMSLIGLHLLVGGVLIVGLRRTALPRT